MATYVLVCGAWLGGWCWQPIARHLRDQGHVAYPLTPAWANECTSQAPKSTSTPT